MLKIYFDNDVYQKLKKQENRQLLDKVIDAKRFVWFFYSLAHLQDLNRDKGPTKFQDMDFMETICENHGMYFTDRTEIVFRTPREYYGDFDWNYTFDMRSSDPIMDLINGLFKSITLNFSELLGDVQWPENTPASIKRMLTESRTMYDFMIIMLEMTDSMTNEQIEFRNLLRFLHNNSLMTNMYEGMGIKGFDGAKVTDRDAFYDSYARKFIKEGKEMSRYELFTEMYRGLEFHAIVKGKPKKQKLMNLIDDGSHAFFGTMCDVIVSNDSDMRNKTQFMYDIEVYGVKVLPFTELESFLEKQAEYSKLSVADLFREMNGLFADDTLLKWKKEGSVESTWKLFEKIYYSYFNMVGMVRDEKGSYWTICRNPVSYNNKPFVIDVKDIVKRLLVDLGQDIEQKGEIGDSEKIDDRMVVRTWVIEENVVDLVVNDLLYLNVYSKEYYLWVRETS